MAKLGVKELTDRSGKLFEQRLSILSLWQTMADMFYPERADFTINRLLGDEFADSLVDSNPTLMRRDLCNNLGAMLRDGEWFHMKSSLDESELSLAGKQWLTSRSNRLMEFMNDVKSGFPRATREGDHDYGTFGQAVISVEFNPKINNLLYRCWHLKDCCWYEDETGQVCGVNRRFEPMAHQLLAQFGEDKVHRKVKEAVEKEPFKPVKCEHQVMPTSMYGDEQLAKQFPYVSIYVDVDNQHVIEEKGIHHKMYIVPRFQTVAGSQYAFSPATVCALPNARTLQAITFTLLEAGERYTQPPMVAKQKAINDIDFTSNGITWIDPSYDEKSAGEAIRPLIQDRGGFPIGLEMRDGILDVLSSAFYLNKLQLPEANNDMTAYEVQERLKQYRREVLPLFAPIESEYNGELCEVSFQVAMRAGLLGSPYDIPQELRGTDIEFKFKSPLSDSEEEQKVNHFRTMSAILAEASQHDEMAGHNVNMDVATRDAITGAGAPPNWLVPAERVVKRRKMEQLVMVAEKEKMNEQDRQE